MPAYDHFEDFDKEYEQNIRVSQSTLHHVADV